MSSIKRKITSSYILIIISTVIIIQIILYVVVKTYYYDNLKDTIVGQIKISSDFYNTYFSSDTVEENILNNVDMFWSNTRCEVQVIDLNGKVLMDSLGNIQEELILTTEVKEAMKGVREPVSLVYKDSKGKSISVATPLYHDTTIDGVLRFTSSTMGIDNAINKLLILILFLGVLVIVISSTVSIFISSSIMKPLKLVCKGAETMAKGNFKETIPKYSKDEIGKLADTLNYMSDEILKNERLKNEFISSVSHELRTPLTSIKGWSIVLGSSDLNDKEEIHEGLNIISEEVERLSLLVEELLDFSKLISGKLTLEKEKTDINHFIKSIVKQLEPRFNEEDMKVKLRLNNIRQIKVDRNKLKQVIINILDNALKYSGKESLVTIEAIEEEEFLKIIVEDNGCGISEKDLPHVKEKFYKGKTGKVGYGIGLSVCDEIINQHGGTLGIKSEVNRGTKVIISLPIGESI